MTELSYTIHGDYAIPNLKLSNPADQPIGKYGRMRKRYLQEYRPVLYAFYTVHLGLNNISGFVQWNYMTQDGYSALLTPRSITLICVGLISKAAARSSWVIPAFSRAALILAPIAQRSMQIPPFGTTNSFRNNYSREA